MRGAASQPALVGASQPGLPAALLLQRRIRPHPLRCARKAFSTYRTGMPASASP